MGVMNTGTGMIATFISAIGDTGPETGTISVAAQSGAFGGHCFTLARERGLGLNLWATMGNQCDVEFSDCLAYMAQDPGTSVVLGYMEGVQDAEKLIEALEIARAAEKPVVLMKVGRSEVGSAAAASHTASLTGSDAVFDALLRQYDVFRPPQHRRDVRRRLCLRRRQTAEEREDRHRHGLRRGLASSWRTRPRTPASNCRRCRIRRRERMKELVPVRRYPQSAGRDGAVHQ